jgi:hypothetical protein
MRRRRWRRWYMADEAEEMGDRRATGSRWKSNNI